MLTDTPDRRKGAVSHVLRKVIDDFKSRDGRVIFLGTGYDNVSYRLYQTFGFTSIEPESGYMELYLRGETPAEFEKE